MSELEIIQIIQESDINVVVFVDPLRLFVSH